MKSEKDGYDALNQAIEEMLLLIRDPELPEEHRKFLIYGIDQVIMAREDYRQQINRLRYGDISGADEDFWRSLSDDHDEDEDA